MTPFAVVFATLLAISMAQDPLSDVELVRTVNTNQPNPGLGVEVFDKPPSVFFLFRPNPFFNFFPFSAKNDGRDEGDEVINPDDILAEIDLPRGTHPVDDNRKHCGLLCLLFGGDSFLPSFGAEPTGLPDGAEPKVEVTEKELPDGTIIRTNKTSFESDDGRFNFHYASTQIIRDGDAGLDDSQQDDEDETPSSGVVTTDDEIKGQDGAEEDADESLNEIRGEEATDGIDLGLQNA